MPGQRLPSERELSQMLEVSRTGVRTALHRLAEAGYVEVRRGRHGGSFVRSDWGPSSADMIAHYLLPNWDRFEALLDARRLIEPVIARAAAERRTEADLVAMREALELLHRRIAGATQNPVLVNLSSQFRSGVSLNLGAEPYTLSVRRTAERQHRELVAAIEARQGEQAAVLAHEHFGLTENLIRDLAQRVRDETGPS